MQEIGITSYYSGLEVLDTYGLADSQIAKSQGPPSGKAAPDYVFGRTPDFFVIRLAANGPRPGLLADRVYATEPRMALEYSLARWFPAAGARLIAVFVRRAGLATAVSLVDRVPAQARFASPAPAYIGEALQQEAAETPALAAAGRLHFKSWLRGVQWNRNDVEGAATLAVDIPDDGTPLFEVTIAPGRQEAAGRYEISLAPLPGAPLPGSRGDAVWASAETGDGVAARDLSVDLSSWRGQRVGVEAPIRGHGPLPRKLARVVDLDGTAPRRPARGACRQAHADCRDRAALPERQPEAGLSYAVNRQQRSGCQAISSRHRPCRRAGGRSKIPPGQPREFGWHPCGFHSQPY